MVRTDRKSVVWAARYDRPAGSRSWTPAYPARECWAGVAFAASRNGGSAPKKRVSASSWGWFRTVLPCSPNGHRPHACAIVLDWGRVGASAMKVARYARKPLANVQAVGSARPGAPTTIDRESLAHSAQHWHLLDFPWKTYSGRCARSHRRIAAGEGRQTVDISS